MNGFKILLGSHSPRRRELLGALDIDFESIKIEDVDEVYPDSLPKDEVPVFLSQLKAKAHSNQLTDGELLITADTVVILDDEILGKPKDKADATAMLKRLSGRIHRVVTGVTLTTMDRSESFSETTEVVFGSLTSAQIEDYVEKYLPLDKAGSYGIQEWIGMVGVSKINGCYYNVMGLPTSALYKKLVEFTGMVGQKRDAGIAFENGESVVNN